MNEKSNEDTNANNKNANKPNACKKCCHDNKGNKYHSNYFEQCFEACANPSHAFENPLDAFANPFDAPLDSSLQREI